jgi:hypothetical protein
MRTDLAQWYHSTKPSVRLQHMTSLDERVNFEINGEDLMLRDINVFCSTKANHRQMLEKMQQLAIQNNTTGASIYDLGKVMQADSMGALESTLKTVEEKTRRQVEEQRAHEQKMAEMQMQQAEKEKAMELDAEARENEKDRRKDLLVAEIKAAGYGSMQDINQNMQSDFQDALQNLKKTEQYKETASVQQQKASDSKAQHMDKMNLKREEMNTKREMKQKDLEIARENKNQYDVKSKNDKKK